MNKRIEFDKSLIKDKKYIIGIDEVGWGCVAGPLVLGGSLIPIDLYLKYESIEKDYPFLNEIKDSKKISEKNRVFLYENILKLNIIKTSVGEVSAEEINHIKLAKSYIKCFESILDSFKDEIKDSLILIDGNRDPKSEKYKDFNLIIKGDDKSFAIGIASIVAKEYRDSYMRNLSDKRYDFERNKGYGTKDHAELIKLNGLSEEHRKDACLKLIREK